MERFLSDLVGAPVVAEKEKAIVGFLRTIIIDPLTGAMAGISLDKKFLRVIPTIDVRMLANPTFISTVDAVCEPDEIIKIASILRTGAIVFNNKVYTKSGIYLGRVYDFAVHSDFLTLTKIAVIKSFLWFFKYDPILLPYTKIIEITPEKIVVEDMSAPKKVRAAVSKVAAEKMKVCTGAEAE